MKNYKVMKEEKDHFVVHDKNDGRQFKVAKKSLDDMAIKKIRKMADGGIVGVDGEPVMEQPSSIGGTNMPLEGMAAPSNLNDLYSADYAPAQVQPPSSIPYENSINNPENVAKLPTSLPEKPKEKEQNPNTVAPKEEVKSPLMQQASYQGESPYTQPQSGSDSMGSLVKDIQAGNEAMKKVYDEQAKIQRDYAAHVENFQKESQQKYAALDAERQKLQQDISSGAIDPHRYWNSMSTGNKVLASIGMLLSGLGSGMARGGPNLAMQVIDNAINRDIEAQKSELGKKENLLAQNLRRYGDLQQAQSATSMQLRDIAQAQIATQASKLGGIQAQQSAQMAIAQLKQASDKQAQDLAMQQARAAMYNSGGGAAMSPAAAQSIAPGSWVRGPDGGALITKTPEDAKKLTDAQVAVADLSQQLDNMIAFSKETGTALTPEKRALAAQMKTYAKMGLKTRLGLGAISENDDKMLEDLASNPGGWNTSSAIAKAEQLKKIVNQGLASEYKSRLINPAAYRNPATTDTHTGMSLTSGKR